MDTMREDLELELAIAMSLSDIVNQVIFKTNWLRPDSKTAEVFFGLI